MYVYSHKVDYHSHITMIKVCFTEMLPNHNYFTGLLAAAIDGTKIL